MIWSSKSIGVIKQLFGVSTNRFVSKDFGVLAFQLPSHEKWRPVDVGPDLGDRKIFQHANAGKTQVYQFALLPIGGKPFLQRLSIRNQRLFSIFVAGDQLCLGFDIVSAKTHLAFSSLISRSTTPTLRLASSTCTTGPSVDRSDLDGRVLGAGRGATDQKRHRQVLPLHFAGHTEPFRPGWA